VLVGLLAAGVVVALAAGGVWAYVMSQYFVGVLASGGDPEQVVIFRGVNAELVGVDFYRLQEETGIMVTDLDATARNSVMDGIPAADLVAAQSILDNLLEMRLPLCPERSTSTVPPATVTETTTGTAVVPTTEPTVGQSPATQAGPSRSSTTGGGSTADGTDAGQSTRSGVNCREED
jgi:protein phosphatase